MSEFVERAVIQQSGPKRKLIFGVGVNDARYSLSIKLGGNTIRCPFYAKWTDMLRRCYCPKYQKRQPTYVGCTVSKEWLTFSCFKQWMSNQDWQGKHLDKDIKQHGNKIYSKDACLFVSKNINNLLCNRAAMRGEWPIGVSYDGKRKTFEAYCSHNGKKKNLGLFPDAKSAHKSYLKYKYKVILETASKPENAYIRQYLINHANMLL